MTLTARLISLLGTLQVPRLWTTTELSREYAVSRRTVRRDMNRLRALGYPVKGEVGVGGGYRWRAGTSVAPLYLDEEEAVAAARGLAVAVAQGVTGVDQITVRALAKFEQVLPDWWRQVVAAAVRHPDAAAASDGRAPVRPALADPATLTTASSAIIGGDRLWLTYRTRDGRATRRRLQPHTLVRREDGWFLVGWDELWWAWWVYRAERIGDIATLAARSSWSRFRRPLPREASPEMFLDGMVGEPEGVALRPPEVAARGR